MYNIMFMHEYVCIPQCFLRVFWRFLFNRVQASLHVIELQRQLPDARVVYCSATGVSDVGNMAYMLRMGLWGPGTAFPDFDTFFESMKKRGVSFLEVLAMEMKSEGKYVARSLSFWYVKGHCCVILLPLDFQG